jgi:putative membrane-bound dehydrogenase-like protein
MLFPYRALIAALLALFGADSMAAGADSSVPPDAGSRANRLSYLDSNDPFYVGARFPRLVTPQWIGEPGVEAVVILAIDDMAETGKYETFLRPILDRLKRIDGHAPVSIMTRSIPVADPQAQAWLAEGVSIECHTVSHPCPLLANGNFEAASKTYSDCIGLLNQIPGNQPVAFRMPCCDSQNSTSPRFFAEIFNQTRSRGKFLMIDSSVMNLTTSSDPALPRELVLASDGQERFRRYFPSTTNSVTRVNLEAFSTTVEDYPYPYVIGKLCWEFPCAVPSDWEAFNLRGPTNQLTVADWRAGLDATVLKQGVFTMVFHPHGWIRNDQMVDLINYAAERYGGRVRFLTFQEAYQRLTKNLLLSQPLRSADGADNGVRLIDLNNDGYLDLVIGNDNLRVTRIWQPSNSQWKDTGFPIALVSAGAATLAIDQGVQFGITGAASHPTAFFRTEAGQGAWRFDGSAWLEDSTFFSGLVLRGEPLLTRDHGRDRGVRLRDLDHDGRCELLVGNESQRAIFARQSADRPWTRRPFSLPADTSVVDANGADRGLRFVDLNHDGFDDLLFSSEDRYALYLFISKPVPHLGWDLGWSYLVRSGTHGEPDDVPKMVRGGTHPNNGSWIHSQYLCVQNEDTTSYPDHTWRVSFAELQQGNQPRPASPAQALSSFRLSPGLQIELVAAEPLVVDPVAFDWGPDGKLWVVEMRDYPLGLDGKGKPGGVIRVLEDVDGDGRYDKSTVFLEGLRFPNGLLPWGKGLLISAAPDLIYAEDTDGDGKADIQKVLFTGFKEGNQQHRINGFEYGLDNWLYTANGGSGGTVRSVATGKEFEMHAHDLRLRPEPGQMELQPGPSQFGRHRDDWGNWFGNDNSHWLWHYFLPEHYLSRNSHLAVDSIFRMLANEPNSGQIFARSRPQQRFNWPTHTFEVTSACSPTPYRDVLFETDFSSSIFICEPANNVVHREVLSDSGVSFTSHRAVGETNSEFLTSTDNWFRPTMVRTGPDGALYVADMYRLIIEHPEYFPEELKRRPDLRAGDDKGRIYRVSPVGVTLRKIPRLDRLDTATRVAALNSPNGWQRDTLQRLLVQAGDLAAVGPLEDLVLQAPDPRTRLQALGTLEGLHSLKPEVLRIALGDSHFAVRRQTIVFAEPMFGSNPGLDAQVLSLVGDPDLRVRYQLAFSLGGWAGAAAGAALARLALRDWTDTDMQTAVLSSAPIHIDQLLHAALEQPAVAKLPETLVENCLSLAAERSSEAILTSAVERLCQPIGSRFASWQIAGVIGLINGLRHRDRSLAEFTSRASPALRAPLAQLPTLFSQARQTAIDPGAPELERLLALRLITCDSGASGPDVTLLGEMVDPQNSPELQEVALAGLRRATNAAVAEVLLARWRAAAPAQRQEILNDLFSRSSWTEAVMTALETGRISPGEIGTLQEQHLLNHPLPEIQQRASRLFAEVSSDRRKVVERYHVVSELPGDRSRGHTLFLQNCSICHALQGEGHSLGPDLGSIADKPVQELVVAILDPNQAVDPAYISYTVTTKDDRELSGILVADTPNSLSLRMPGGVQETVLRSQVRAMTSAGRSPMPEGFETGLKPQDLADLIAYITSTPHPSNP